MLIILGVRKADASPPKHESEVKDAIIKLLRDELGLEVLSAGPRIAALNKGSQLGSTLELHNLESIVKSEGLPTEMASSTRRPVVLQRLKITKKSLHHWLQRRVGVIRR